jgi:hypothetical protein
MIEVTRSNTSLHQLKGLVTRNPLTCVKYQSPNYKQKLQPRLKLKFLQQAMYAKVVITRSQVLVPTESLVTRYTHVVYQSTF